MNYKYYSFDVWNTLISTNPEFKKNCCYFISDYIYNVWNQRVAPFKIREVFSSLSRFIDNQTLILHSAFSTDMYYLMLLERLGVDISKVSKIDLGIIYSEVQKLFMMYPPVPYDSDTLNVMNAIRSECYSMMVISNTSSVGGDTLRMTLDVIGFPSFDTYNFSDKIGVSKPSSEIFHYAHKSNPLMCNIDKQSILHVGDDKIRDGVGAKNYGFNSQIINTTSLTIKSLLHESVL